MRSQNQQSIKILPLALYKYIYFIQQMINLIRFQVYFVYIFLLYITDFINLLNWI